MFQKIEKKSGPGLQRIVNTVEGDMVVHRPSRRPISGVVFHAQKSRLILDAPDTDGNESYPCRVADMSDGGFGVVCSAADKVPEVFQPGAQMTLEAWDSKQSRVEIRWIKNGRLGLRRMPHRR
jgi:hypothetical protein